MVLAYFDSSALVKLLVEEDGSDVAAAVWDGCDAALAAAGRDHQASPEDLATAETTWEGYWAAVRAVELSADVATEAGRLAARHALRGADVVHLASLLAVSRTDCLFVGWDRRLHAGATAAGVRVVPAGL